MTLMPLRALEAAASTTDAFLGKTAVRFASSMGERSTSPRRGKKSDAEREGVGGIKAMCVWGEGLLVLKLRLVEAFCESSDKSSFKRRKSLFRRACRADCPVSPMLLFVRFLVVETE